MTYPPQADGYAAGASGYPGQYGQVGQPAPSATATGAGRYQIGPPSNVGWAVVAILCFWPLSFVAMTRALQVYPLWAAGRYAEAEAASAMAKKLGIISMAVVVALFVLYIAFIVVMVGLASTSSW